MTKSTAREGIFQVGRPEIHLNSFTIGKFSRVFSFPLSSTTPTNIVQIPCWTNLFAFIIETTFGVVPVLVHLNLKLGHTGGENFIIFFCDGLY